MPQRLRDLGFEIGPFPTGELNAITDVEGVRVGHRTVERDEPHVARTGVTIIEPRPLPEAEDLCFGAYVSFNGNGEMTGSHWLDESGLLAGPIGITNTHQVGLVRDQLVAEVLRRVHDTEWCLPIVAETYDGFLNDIASFPLRPEDVQAALAAAGSEAGTGPVAEGNVGGGTGMICHGFKGGIGTSSRVVPVGTDHYTVGVLVQANYGNRRHLRLDGRPIGRMIDAAEVPEPTDPRTADAGSIIIVVATDAPLLADQCKRLARRATVGLARVGGNGANGSGDIFLAFSTGNRIPSDAVDPVEVRTLPAGSMSPLFEATADAVEESIWNALCAAETTVGHLGRTVNALPTERLIELR